MKTKLLLAIFCALLTCYTTNSNAQANTILSNLTSPTAINQSLLPTNDNKKDLGSNGKSWRKIYFDGQLYLKGTIAMHSPGTGNFFTGNGAGNLSLTGSNNTGVGQAALASNTTGSYNTATGNGALLNNMTGSYNTANGYYSLVVNSDGFSNTASGYASLYSNTSGGDNTATGVNAMYNNQTGSYNSSYGRFSMFSNTTGSSNIAIGANALFSNTAGYSNVAVGSGALYKNGAGSNLVAVGDSALYNNRGGFITGNYNVALGSKALYSNTSGSENTANGFYTLYSNTDGGQNTADGFNVLFANTTGYSNTANGYNALSRNIGGHNNTAVGVFSGSSTSGIGNANNYCSFFGSFAAQTVSMDFTNSMALGNTATITASNQVRIGNGSITSIGGWEPWTDLSDARFKKNVKENVPGLEFISRLRPVTYTMDVTQLRSFLGEDRQHEISTAEGKIVREKNPEAEALVKKGIEEKEKIIRTGFVAQEVEEAAKKIGYDFNGVDKPQNAYTPYGLRYSEFVVPLVKAVQELSKMNDELKKQNEEQQKQIDELKVMITGNTKNSITLSDASLDQNIPNPFNKATVINYTLPQQFVNAQIVITDNNGKMLKQINISGSGNGTVNIDAATLAAGAYSYALYIDKKLIASKQMVLTK